MALLQNTLAHINLSFLLQIGCWTCPVRKFISGASEQLTTLAIGNSSFSKQVNGWQFAIDSTSLGAAKTCPRYYYLSIVRGLQPRAEQVHLVFGLHLHAARERYEHNKLKGLTHDNNLDEVLDFSLKATWNRELNRPWISGDDKKNRKTLIQTLVWYLDEMANNDNLQTVVLADGRPAVELSFRFDSGIRMGDEAVIFCGHLDRIAEMGGRRYIPDIKTSGSEVSPRWAAGFTPGNQFSMYALAGKVAFAEPVEGVIVDGVQVGVGFARFARYFVPRDAATIAEWREETEYWIGQMYRWALREQWPANDKSCDQYGGCQFRGVCSKPPSQREALLAADFAPRVWDPLQTREI